MPEQVKWGVIGSGGIARRRTIPEGIAAAPNARLAAYRAEIEAFGRAVLEGREPAVGAEAGARSQRVLAACYESARTGRAVEV